MTLLKYTRGECEELTGQLVSLPILDLQGKVDEITQREGITAAQLFYFLLCKKSIPNWHDFTDNNIAVIELMNQYELNIKEGRYPDILVLKWVRLPFSDAVEQSKYQKPNLTKCFGLSGRVVRTKNNVNAYLDEEDAKKKGQTTNNYLSATPEYDTLRKAIKAGEKEYMEDIEFYNKAFNSKAEKM